MILCVANGVTYRINSFISTNRYPGLFFKTQNTAKIFFGQQLFIHFKITVINLANKTHGIRICIASVGINSKLTFRSNNISNCLDTCYSIIYRIANLHFNAGETIFFIEEGFFNGFFLTHNPKMTVDFRTVSHFASKNLVQWNSKFLCHQIIHCCIDNHFSGMISRKLFIHEPMCFGNLCSV